QGIQVVQVALDELDTGVSGRQSSRVFYGGLPLRRSNDIPANKDPMLESAQSSVTTKVSSRSVAETVDRLKHFIEVRGFTLLRVIDHRGTAERVGVQMPDSKLVMFGNPPKGAAVMLAAPLAALDFPDDDGGLARTRTAAAVALRALGEQRLQPLVTGPV